MRRAGEGGPAASCLPRGSGPPAWTLGGAGAVKIIAVGPQTFEVAARPDPPPRLQLRLGPLVYTLTSDEAIDLASQLIDRVDALRADTRNTQRKEPQ
jgi:hypothetical protein